MVNLVKVVLPELKTNFRLLMVFATTLAQTTSILIQLPTTLSALNARSQLVKKINGFVTLVVNALNVVFTPMQISLTQYARMILAVLEKFLTLLENAKSALSTPSQTLLARSAQVIFVSQIKSF